MYCIGIKLRDSYERLLSEKENKLWITLVFSELEEKHSSYHQRKFQTVCFDSGRIIQSKILTCLIGKPLGRIMTVES